MRVNDFSGLVPADAVQRIRQSNRIAAGLDPVTGKAFSKRGASTGRGMVKISSDLGFTSNILTHLPLDMRARAAYDANIAAARVVRKQAALLLKQAGPRAPGTGMFPGNSKRTKTYEKMSKKQQAKRDSRKSMAARIITKSLPKRRGSSPHILTMVGPRRDDGRMDQGWILEYGGVIRLWGSDRYYRLKPRPFMGPAGKATTTLQMNAYKATMRKWWNDVGRYTKKYGGYAK